MSPLPHQPDPSIRRRLQPGRQDAGNGRMGRTLVHHPLGPGDRGAPARPRPGPGTGTMGPLRRLQPRRQARRRRGVGGRFVWSAEDARIVARDAGAVGHRARVQSRWPASGNRFLDGGLKLWEARTGRQLRYLSRNLVQVQDLAFLRTGQSRDDLIERTVRLWDVGTGRRRSRSRAESRERSERRASSVSAHSRAAYLGVGGKARVQSRRKAVGVHGGRRNDSRDWISTI